MIMLYIGALSLNLNRTESVRKVNERDDGPQMLKIGIWAEIGVSDCGLRVGVKGLQIRRFTVLCQGRDIWNFW